MRIVIVVTHLLGAGHLRRSMNLAQAFAGANHNVTVISGGMPVAQFSAIGFAVEQLPPIRSDGSNFLKLMKADGAPVDEPYLASRKSTLQNLLRRIQPTALVTELFPFGRRVLRTEFIGLLEAASVVVPKPVIVSSVRDILAPPSTEIKARQTDALLEQYYDAVLVHSDVDVVSLDKSWPLSFDLSPKIRYTGYVAEPIAEQRLTSLGKGEIIVSAGSGSVGAHLFDVAVETASQMPQTRWRILVGGAQAKQEVVRLQDNCISANIVVEPVRTDFRQLLAQCECSVSLCGYNTAIDLLQTGTPGVLIPFDEGGETEQTIRAESLSQQTYYTMLKARDLHTDALCRSVRQVLDAGRYVPSQRCFRGADETVNIVEKLVQDKHESYFD